MSITIPVRLDPMAPEPHHDSPLKVERYDPANHVPRIGEDDAHEFQSQQGPEPAESSEERHEQPPTETEDAAVVHLSRAAELMRALGDEPGQETEAAPAGAHGPEHPSGPTTWMPGGPQGGHWHAEYGCAYCGQAVAAYRKQSVPPGS